MSQIYNPYLPSYEYIPDGEPHVFGDRLYIYGSHDRFGSDYYCPNDYVTYSAPVDDLTSWRYEGIIYKKNQDPINTDGKMSLFAPDVVQGPDGRYYLYYGMDFISSISVAVADTPTGPFEFYGYVKHADGQTYGENPERDPFQFDPAVLVDDDKRIYLYTGFGPGAEVVAKVKEVLGLTIGNTGNHVVELDSDMLTLKTEPKQFLPNSWDSEGTGFEGHAFYEASSIRKFNGKYYFIYSSVLSHELSFAVSDSPTEGFVYGGALHSNADIGVNDNTEAQNYWGNNHGSVVGINGKYYVFGHRQTDYTEFSRQGVAEEIELGEDGLFKQAELTSCGLNGGPLAGKGTYPAAIACLLMGPNGAMKSVEVVTDEQKAEHPCITQELEDNETTDSQYIKNLISGAKVGYKYFDFDEPETFALTYRGTAEGRILVSTEKDGPAIAVLEVVTSPEWRDQTASISQKITGKQALYLTFEGTGSLDVKAFTLA
ncbi:family 43 glycosylhydrolase [Streptococcus castoreus]|uniref:family 43 glycosylhydrolase n=1 Tax=Streptococcus castoreus TaxID=254786 RepID=UPI0003FAA926|nr:family 43 glycosylhydrolase [Streptococcus castoreus]